MGAGDDAGARAAVVAGARTGLRHDLGRRWIAGRAGRPGVGRLAESPSTGCSAARASSSRSACSSLRWAVSRSASRRELANTMVEWWALIRSRILFSTCGQIDGCGGGAPSQSRSRVGVEAVDARSPMSSTGTTTERSQDLDAGGATTVTGWAPAEIAGHPLRGSDGRGQPDPLEGSGTLPVGRCGAGLGRPARRRGRRVAPDDRARWAPRLVPASACTSSTITVSHVPEHVPGRRGEHQEQRLRRGDQDVRRAADDLATVPGRGVARAHADADGRRGLAQPQGGLGDAGEGGPQVALDVDRQRLERGDVEHPTALLGRRMRIPDQRVEGGQEGRQGLAGPGRRDDQRVLPRRDGLPRPGLSGRGLGEHLGEPGGGRRAERGQRVRRGRGLNRHPHILPGPTDSGDRCASWDFGPAALVSTSEVHVSRRSGS